MSERITDLVSFAEFAPQKLHPRFTRAVFERLSSVGLAPRAVRWQAPEGHVYRKAEIDAWLARTPTFNMPEISKLIANTWLQFSAKQTTKDEKRLVRRRRQQQAAD